MLCRVMTGSGDPPGGFRVEEAEVEDGVQSAWSPVKCACPPDCLLANFAELT